MNKKRNLVTAVVVGILCLLVYLQVHAWKKFDWGTLLKSTEGVKWTYVALSVAIIYVVYALRAVRWRIFLKSMCSTTTARLIAPQFIGFAALALLGRPGEMVRPYLIAKKENLTFSSQVAIWLVERVFDTGSVGLIFLFLVFKGDSFWKKLPPEMLHKAIGASEALMLLAVAVLLTAALVLRQWGYAIAARLEQLLQRRNAKLAHSIRTKIVAFTDGLLTIRDWTTLGELLAWSLLMWWLVAVSYWLILHAYGGQLAETHYASVLLLMVIAMFGSLIQLPGVGGGSQLATIAVLNHVFGVDNEIAVSCGMLIWLATFMSVIVPGLLLAHREKLSLRSLVAAEESEAATLQ
jgi:uncharacterized protein (TIRG00374 family)